MEVTESKDNENNEDNLSRLSGLAEPNRRLLYDFIVSQNDYVSREQQLMRLKFHFHLVNIK